MKTTIFNYSLLHQKQISQFILNTFCIFLILLVSACGEVNQEASLEMGSIDFGVRFYYNTQPTQRMNQRTALGDPGCDVSGVDTVESKVYNASGSHLRTGGPWPCSAKSGTIQNVPAGTGRNVIVLGMDTAGDIIFRGEQANITVIAGQTASTGAIEALSFMPTLVGPPNGFNAIGETLSLQWNEVSGAKLYRIIISENNNMDPYVVNATTPGTTYSPSGQLSGNTFYWQIFAIDQNGNESAGSEIRRFNLLDFPEFTEDPNDNVALSIIQTIPNDDATDVPVSSTITIYFDDEINPSTISDITITIMDSSDNQIYGTYSGELSTYGHTILFINPYEDFPENDEITVTLVHTDGITDDNGNTLSYTHSFSFNTISDLPSPGDYSFETGLTGWFITGDGDIVSTTGDVAPTDGSYMLGISTGLAFEGSAQSDATSTLTSGPIHVPTGTSHLSFDYDFISQEFDDWVDEGYDDSFTLTISGPNRSYSNVVDSVNIIGTEESVPLSLPILPNAEHTGWKPESIDIQSLGSPITISFSITDVGDTAYDSVLFIDNINFTH